ncbi:MAG: hypothetical protein LBE80_05695 [Deltaproteobacteria bacterium]|nr:hypothetical protein [Deltaproteobacteria bacterium]
MRRIPIDKAVPGQILAEKLTRHDGVLLAGQGSEITEGLLRMLSRMNIDTVVIEEEESRTAEQVMEDFRDFVSQLEARFVRVTTSPVLMALKKTMLFMAQKERDLTLALIDKPNSSTEASERPPADEPLGSA